MRLSDSDIKVLDGIYYKRCLICSEFFRTKKSHVKRRKTCGKECDSMRRTVMYVGDKNPNYGNRGPKNPMFKGGVRINNLGYREVYKPEHPNATGDGYVLEHRYIMSEHLGRPLTVEEVVHHKDENKLNNDINNLEVLSRGEHTRLHSKDFRITRCVLGRIVKTERIG